MGHCTVWHIWWTFKRRTKARYGHLLVCYANWCALIFTIGLPTIIWPITKHPPRCRPKMRFWEKVLGFGLIYAEGTSSIFQTPRLNSQNSRTKVHCYEIRVTPYVRTFSRWFIWSINKVSEENFPFSHLNRLWILCKASCCSGRRPRLISSFVKTPPRTKDPKFVSC
jgi:hypothetical protein